MIFVPARNYTRVGGRDIDLVVIHDMEYPERPTAAEWCANYFAGPNAPRASAHYMIDNNSIVQGVRDMDVAWAAPGANHNGLQLEHAGYARQTKDEWLDTYGRQMLTQSARLTAGLCARYEIPVRWVGVKALLAGERGLTTHADVSAAFRRSNHFDPGPDFPKDVYIRLVRTALRVAAEFPAPLPHWRWEWARWKLGEGEYRKYRPGKGPMRPDVPLLVPPHVWAWYAKFKAQRR